MLIAQRGLAFETTDGAMVEIPVRLYAPEGNDKLWWCRYSIGWPDGIKNSKGYGIDQFQAISLTLQKIGAEIYCSDYHKTGRLQWDKPGSGYGFPVSTNIRNLLVGDDERFDG